MKMPHFRYSRTVVPLLMFLVTILFMARQSYPLPTDYLFLTWYSRLDPLLLFSYLRWERAFPLWGWLPVATLLLTLLLGRFFCGWLCPVGGLLTGLTKVKEAIRWAASGRSVPTWTSQLYPYRYYWLAILLGMMAAGSGWPLFLSPFYLLTEELSRLWTGHIPWLLLGLLFLGTTLFPRFWCVFLCPTGLLLSFVARWRQFVVQAPDGCVNCDLCQITCPSGAAGQLSGQAGQECLLCGRCSQQCPVDDLAINVRQQRKKLEVAPGRLFTRRELFRATAALSVFLGSVTTLSLPAKANPLRPPGALDEAEFLARCSRCGRCIKVCPAKCISPMPLSEGAAQFLTPVIIPRQACCELTQDCQKVCPTGALGLLPVAKTVIGLAVIDQSRCLGWAQGKLCLICQEQCPQQAVDSDDLNRPSIIIERCVGCGACENACPVESPAIVVQPQLFRRRD